MIVPQKSQARNLIVNYYINLNILLLLGLYHDVFSYFWSTGIISVDCFASTLARAICVVRGMTTRGASVGTRNYEGNTVSSPSVKFSL